MRPFITSIVFLMITTGCTKNFDLEIESAKPLYVIEGRISNLTGPYYVRVTRSAGLLPPSQRNGDRDSAEPVKDALLIITDDAGTTDTLIAAFKTIERYIYFFKNGVMDSALITKEERNTIYDRGFYQTTKIKGIPGHTYRLRVETGGEVFLASAYMPPIVELDNAAFRDTMVSPWNTSFPVPVAYFTDPPGEKNYYMLKVQEIAEYRYDNYFGPNDLPAFANLDYFILDDKLLGPQSNAIPFFYTMQEDDREVIPYMWKVNLPRQMRLGSLTKEAYDYFNIFAKQFSYDGNIYKPTPTSPPGNISGGALGLFFASSISDKFMFPL